MKLKIVTVELELTRRQKCLAMLLGAVAVAGLGASVAVAMVPHQFAAGQLLKASDLNENFDDLDARLAALEAPKSDVIVVGSPGYTAAMGAFTHVPYMNVASDAAGEWDAATGKFTADASGRYLVCAGGYTPNHTVVFELDTFVNDVRSQAFALSQDLPNNGVFASGCGTVTLAAGDKLDVRVYQNNVASAGFAGATYWDTLSIRRL